MKKYFFILKIIFSVILITFLFSKIDFKLFISSLSKANLWFILLGILCFCFNTILSALRWRIALKHFQIEEKMIDLCRYYLIGLFFNNFLPSSFGGDGYKYIVLSKKYSNKKHEIFSSLIFDRGTGFFSLFLVNIILFFLYTQIIISNKQLLIVQLCIIFGFFILISLFLLRNYFQKLFKKIGKRFNLYSKIQNLFSIFSNLGQFNLVKPAIFYSLLFIVMGAIWYWLYIYAFGYSVSFLYLLFSLTIIQISGIIPISLNSIGIAEGLFVFLLNFVGLPLEISLVVALSVRVMSMLLSLMGGVLYLLVR